MVKGYLLMIEQLWVFLNNIRKLKDKMFKKQTRIFIPIVNNYYFNTKYYLLNKKRE